MPRSTIIPDALYWATFNSFELRLPGECVLDCSHSGSCDEEVAFWTPKIRAQIEADNFPNKPTIEKARKELSEHGADWDASEGDDDTWWQRLVWVAACNIAEEDEPDCTAPVKPQKP